MNTATKEQRKIIALTFPPDISGNPIMCSLAKNYDLTFNILKARITPRQEGHMVVELQGSDENYRLGTGYLEERGVSITPVAQHISKDEEACIHCGICTAMCSKRALVLDTESRIVLFNSDLCSACGLCTLVCPVQAMKIHVDELVW